MTIADIVPATARMRAMGHHQSQIQRRTFVRHRVMPMHAHVHVNDDSPVKHSHLSIDVGVGSLLPPVVVATAPLPRADSVGYVPRERAVLQACTIVNQIREVLNQSTLNNSPSRLLFIRISKERDFLSTWKYQPERPLNAVHRVKVVDVTMPALFSRSVLVIQVIIFNSNGLLQVNCSHCPFRHVIEGNEVAPYDTQLAATPRLVSKKC